MFNEKLIFEVMSSVSQEDFIDSLNSYLSDNYNENDIKIITEFKTNVGQEKQNKVYHLYRGVFYNNLPEDKKQEIIKIKSFLDKEMSYTTDLSVAKAFAHGSNIYENDLSSLKNDQFGFVVEGNFSPNEVVIDIDYAIQKGLDIESISEHEVLVKPKNRNLNVIYIAK
jgi:hypothetical protein